MDRSLVFVPVSQAERAIAAAGGTLTRRRAFTVTPELLAALEYGPEEIEEAEYAAMVIAGVAGLTICGERTVLVAEVKPEAVGDMTDPENGEFLLAELPASEVVAFFADDQQTDLSAAAQVCRGKGIDEAWGTTEVQELLSATDMLWYGAEELGNAAS